MGFRDAAPDPSVQQAQLLAGILRRLQAVENRGPSQQTAARLTHSATQNVSTGTPTVVDWAGTPTYDPSGMHTASSRATDPVGAAALWIVSYAVTVPGGSGRVEAWVTVGGAGVWAHAETANVTGGLVIRGADVVPVGALDYLQVVVQQTSGGTLAVGDGDDHFTVARLGAWS